MGVVTFDGKSSDYFGIEVSAPPRYIIPAEDYTSSHVNGQTGDRMKAWRSYKNIDQEYTCNFLVDNMMPVPGDANGDETVTAADVGLIERWLSDNHYSDLSTRGFRAADVNSDGVVDSSDSTAIGRSLVHDGDLPYSYPVDNYFGVVTDTVNAWLKPYYSKKEIDYKLKAYRIRGTFETSKDGYYKLEDSYFPAIYKKAIIKGDTSIETLYEQGGAFKLTFNCDPRKYYKIGEQWIDSAEDNPTYPVIDYSKGEVLTHSYWWGPDVPPSNDGNTLHISNHLRYPASPLMRIFIDINDFDDDKIPTVLQIFIKSERGVVNETRRLRFDLSEVDLGTRENPNYITLYIDFATCEVYFLPARKSEIIAADTSDAALDSLIISREITSFSDYLTTEFIFTPDTGLLLPGKNKIKTSFWRADSNINTVTELRNFQIMPRWWTL